MKQLTQKLGDGAMAVLEVATPSLGKGMVLVRNHFSLISAGTEGSTVSAARKSLIGKARERPQQVQQVVDSLKQQGPVQTYRAVRKKLDSYSPLGYSAAGVVIDAAPDVRGVSIGDNVACAGLGYANHAEVIAVPENLCVPLLPNADLCHAAYNTLGAIALQGVRQADLRVGETCVVIGLGLLGQLTGLILKASGIKVVGLDIDQNAIDVARAHWADTALNSEAPGIASTVDELTDGIGADAVIITAATHSTQPINLAGRLLRKRGSVVVVGNVPTGFERDPDYYRKELTLKMSCSYGPGRYDLGYEEKGLDYPAGYVRWTENRNMRAFQELVQSGQIDIDYLTTHRFSIDESPTAYDLILKRTENVLGVIIAYDTDKEISRAKVVLKEPGRASLDDGRRGIGFIGAGSYAMSHLLPNLPRDERVALTGVMTASGTSSRSVAEKYGFSFCASAADDIINDQDTDTVFIATRHDTHAQYVLGALEAGKQVFVEKPVCLTEQELSEIVDTWSREKQILMVGFNRRFSPLAEKLKKAIGDGPVAMTYRINAGNIPKDTWIQDTDLGGGRIVGEVCHFIDLMVFISGSPPVAVYASAMKDPAQLDDTVSISLRFANGSIGSISYFANGSKSLPKEYLEVYRGGTIGIINDFKELSIHGGGKPARSKLLNQDKGQRTMVARFVEAVTTGGNSPIPFAETYATTIAAFGAVVSLRTHAEVALAPLSD